MTKLLPLLLALPLSAGDLDLYVSLGSLSPGNRGGLPRTDTLGQPVGAGMTLGSDFQQLGLGGTYTLLSYGNWRLRGQLEGMRGLGTSRFSVLYSGATPGHYLDVSGRVETQTIAPGVNLTYVSSGAGEYGLTVEPHYSILRWRTDRLVVDFPGIKGRFPEERRSISFNDTFLSLHATYLLRFAAFGVVTRVAYGVNVSGKRRDIGSYSEAELASVSRDLLETVRPRQELKFSAGVRF